jgi:hypothetical protein
MACLGQGPHVYLRLIWILNHGALKASIAQSVQDVGLADYVRRWKLMSTTQGAPWRVKARFGLLIATCLFRWFAALCMVPLGVSPANADTVTLFDNSEAANDAFFTPLSPFGPLFASFSTGSSPTNSELITLLLGVGDNTDKGGLTVTLRKDNLDAPGAVIGQASLADTDFPSSNFIFPVEFPDLTGLSANSRYWVELSATGSVIWAFTLDDTGPGVAGEFEINQSAFFPNSSGSFEMLITADVTTDGSTTPLPATLPLFATGLGGLGLLGWRRKRKAFRRFEGGSDPMVAIGPSGNWRASCRKV